MRPSHLLLALLVLAPGLAATAHAKSQKAESPLVRPDNPPDGDAKGRVRVVRDTKKNRDKLNVEAEHLDLTLTYDLWVEDAQGSMQLAGTLQPVAPGEVEIEFDTKEGPPLPVGASDVDELAGRRVEVRSGSTLFLFGTVPSLSAGGGGGGGGGSGGGGGGSSWIQAKSALLRPFNPPDGDAKGVVEVRRRDKDQRQKFKVEAEHVDPNLGFSVWLEDPVGSGVLNQVGAMVQKASDEVELELDTGDGDPLPLGVTTVDDLAGRLVAVRDGLGATYLSGVVPALSGSNSKSQKAKTKLTGSVGKGEIRLKSVPKAPKEELRIKIRKQAKKSDIEIWMFDASSGQMTLVASLTTNDSGKATYKVNTKKGQPLPLGALELSELAGVAVEVRAALDQSVLLTGTIPAL